MARKNPNISISIDGEADLSKARKDVKSDLGRMEDDARDAAKAIDRAFANLSPELDTSEIRQALDLAKQLDGMVAEFTVDTDLAEIRQAEQLAKSLRGFQARVDLSVEGREELADALDLAAKMDQIRRVKVEVQGRQDLEKAADLADDLERRRTVPIDAQASDLVRLDNEIEASITEGGRAGSEGIAGALGGLDLSDVGGGMAEQLAGGLAAAGPYAAAAGAVGAVFGESFLEGFNNALPDTRGDTIRQLRNNLADSDMVEVGRAGGAAYSAGLSEGLTAAKDAAALLKGELGGIDKGLNLDEAVRQAMALEQVFGVELADSVTAVDKLVSQGLVKNSQEGFNLLFELGQKTGTQFDEMLELTNEFSTAIKALGIEGPKGLQMIADMVEQGIFPQVDQAGEVFEELNETIINGGAAEALELIGLNAEEMQQRIASGGFEASSAVSEIAATLLAIDDNALQASATAEIFGGNMGLLGDEAREAALQLFVAADGTEEVGTAASDAADKIEESASGLDRLKKAAVELGNEMAGPLVDGLDTLNSLADLDFGPAADSAGSFGESLASHVIAPLGMFSDLTGRDPFGPLKDAFDELRGKTDDFAESTGPAVAGAEALSTAAREGAPRLEELGVGADNAAAAIAAAQAATEQLDAALQLFSGRFDEDQIMRRIEEDTIAATEAVKGLEAGTYTLGTGFDISTEKGRNAQAALEDLSGSLDTAIAAYQNGTITGQQLADKHAVIEGSVREVASAMNATQAETDELIGKYAAVPSDVSTIFHAETQAAMGAVAAYAGAILAVPTSRTTTITTYQQTVVRPTANDSRFGRASGGPVRAGEMYTVGELGRELFVPDEDGQIIDHASTREILENNPGARALGGSAGSAAGGAAGGRVVLELRSSGSDADEFLIRMLRKSLRNRGGNLDVVFS